MRDWNLRIMQTHWTTFSIGVGFNLSTPAHKLRYSDLGYYRCVSLILHLMGAQIHILVPVFKLGAE
jgi:hypothetical protein